MSDLPFPAPGLTDGVVVLRQWCPQDASVISAWAEDPDLVRWTGAPRHYTPDDARAYMRSSEQSRQEGRAMVLAIVEAGADVVIGSCDIRRPDPEDPALGEIGYLLRAQARGRGLATRSVRLIVDWGFRELGMGRVQALVHPDNPSSARILERLGFRREGVLRRYRAGPAGREDRVLFAILPSELVPPSRVAQA